MKKFLIGLFKFLLIPLFAILLVESIIELFKVSLFEENRIARLYSNDIAQYEWIKQMDSDSIIVLAGSSSVRYGLSCTELNNLSNNQFQFINIAMDARDPIVSYFILKKMDLKKVSAIYFGLDSWIFSKRYYKHRNNYMYLDFSLVENIKFANEHDKSAFLKRYKSLYSDLIDGNDKLIVKNNVIPTDFGSVELKSKPANFNERVESWFQIDKYGWSELQFEYLKKIVDLCKSKNVKLNFFIPPKRSDFTSEYRNRCQEIHKDYLFKLEQIISNNEVFGQFSQLNNIGDSIFFADGLHLNANGQKKYSEIFYKLTQEKHRFFSKDYSWY